MSPPPVLILRAAGTNCDQETAYAFGRAGGRPAFVHLNELLARPALLAEHRILCLPGGFTYGDDLSAGKILANQLSVFLQDHLQRFLDRGSLVLGICNGFQTLVKAGILPGGSRPWKVEATLAANDSGKFEGRWVRLECPPSVCVFTRGMRSIELPVAHGEGRFLPVSEAVRQRIVSEKLAAFRYAPAPGEPLRYPADPNGSVDRIAGLCDPTGRVLGMMPHPERFVDRLQHPAWTRSGVRGDGEGLQVFRNAVDTLQ